MGRSNNNRSRLARSKMDELFRAIWDGLDPNGAPIRLAEVVAEARGRASDLDGLWDFGLLVSDELQRMKRAGCAILVKGPGGGWKRGDSPDTYLAKAAK